MHFMVKIAEEYGRRDSNGWPAQNDAPNGLAVAVWFLAGSGVFCGLG